MADDALEALHKVCERYRSALVFIHHFNKTGRTIEAAIGGAGAVTRVARTVYIFGQEPLGLRQFLHGLLEDEDDETDSEEQVCVLANVKLNLAPKPPALRFVSTAVEIPAVESVHRLELVGETDVTDEAVFEQLRAGPVNPEQQTEVATAVEFVLNALIEGPLPTRELIADANAHAISKRTWNEPSAQLGCESIHPSRLRERLGEEAYEALDADRRKAWWIALPAMPDAPPEEWAA